MFSKHTGYGDHIREKIFCATFRLCRRKVQHCSKINSILFTGHRELSNFLGKEIHCRQVAIAFPAVIDRAWICDLSSTPFPMLPFFLQVCSSSSMSLDLGYQKKPNKHQCPSVGQGTLWCNALPVKHRSDSLKLGLESKHPELSYQQQHCCIDELVIVTQCKE